MVDLAVLQSVSYIAGALGVCVAAFYYVMTLKTQQQNMRETMSNRRATFTSNQMQYSGSEDWARLLLQVLYMQWTDFEDFKKKYDSSTNPEYTAKRMAILSRYDSIGRQYRAGLIGLDDVGSAVGYVMVAMWLKFKPVIEGYRRTEYPVDAYSDFEFVAEAMLERLTDRDPDFMKKLG